MKLGPKEREELDRLTEVNPPPSTLQRLFRGLVCYLSGAIVVYVSVKEKGWWANALETAIQLSGCILLLWGCIHVAIGVCPLIDRLFRAKDPES